MLRGLTFQGLRLAFNTISPKVYYKFNQQSAKFMAISTFSYKYNFVCLLIILNLDNISICLCIQQDLFQLSRIQLIKLNESV